MANKTELYPHEWLAIIFIVSIMGILTLIAQTNYLRPLPSAHKNPHFVVDQTLIVFVEGACEFPGRYECRKGELVENILDQVKPFPGAIMKRYRPEAKLRDGQVIRIIVPKKKGRKVSEMDPKTQGSQKEAKKVKKGENPLFPSAPICLFVNMPQVPS